jgi:hypothetical protein
MWGRFANRPYGCRANALGGGIILDLTDGRGFINIIEKEERREL